jgi:hypothetical protein
MMFKRTILSLSLAVLALVAQASLGNAKLEGAHSIQFARADRLSSHARIGRSAGDIDPQCLSDCEDAIASGQYENLDDCINSIASCLPSAS